jgi:hypothetical protein
MRFDASHEEHSAKLGSHNRVGQISKGKRKASKSPKNCFCHFSGSIISGCLPRLTSHYFKEDDFKFIQRPLH